MSDTWVHWRKWRNWTVAVCVFLVVYVLSEGPAVQWANMNETNWDDPPLTGRQEFVVVAYFPFVMACEFPPFRGFLKWYDGVWGYHWRA